MSSAVDGGNNKTCIFIKIMKFMHSVTLIILIFSLIVVEPKWKGIEKSCLCQEFRCANGTACLHKTRVCNGYKDCQFGEDEDGYKDKSCFKRVVPCNPTTEFKCKFGGCIKIVEVCDGVIHCIGATDEATDFCKWVHGEENATAVNPH